MQRVVQAKRRDQSHCGKRMWGYVSLRSWLARPVVESQHNGTDLGRSRIDARVDDRTCKAEGLVTF